MSGICGSSKPFSTPLTAWLWSQETRRKAVEGNADPTQEPVAYRRFGGGGGLYGEQTTERHYRKANL